MRHHHSIANIVGGHASGPHLQVLGIKAEMQIVPLTPTTSPCFFHFHSPSSSRLIPVKSSSRFRPAKLGRHVTCTSRLRWRRPAVLMSGTGCSSPDQPVVTDKACGLPQAQSKEVFDGQAELNGRILEPRAAPALGAGSGKRKHAFVRADAQ